jgi:hypothetical protein
MAKKTTPKRTAGVKKKPRVSVPELLVPARNEIIVRMYRQGLGDCFLLMLPAGDSGTKYLLIDCGVHKRQTDGSVRLAQVLDNLVVATGSRIDVVVATHEHADHLSGFVQKGSPFLTDDLKIGEVWMAWTEKRGDKQADTLRKKRGAAQRLIDKAVEEARERAGRGMDGLRLAEKLEHLMDFDVPEEGSIDLADVEAKVKALRKNSALPIVIDDPPSDDAAPGLGVAKKKKKNNPSSNELAIALLALKVGDDKAKYCEPGKVRTIDGVDNLRAYVLGPPRSDLLEKDKPSKIRGAKEDDPGGAYKEVYLTPAGGNRCLALNPRFGLSDGTGALLSEDWRYPFWDRYQRRYELKTASDDTQRNRRPRRRATEKDRFVWNRKRPAPPRETRSMIDRYLDPGAAWRRIDSDWLGAAEALALDLASDTNNTSLALAFEWGTPGRGRVLLFAADAQVGNWLSWRDQTYGTRKLKVDNLLDRVLLYKVGHHGSHNATVRRDPRDTSSPDPFGAPFGLELMNDIIAMIPVDQDAAKKKMPDPWKMPHEPLYLRLREKARLRVLRSDLSMAPLDEDRNKRDVVPKDEDWKPVPGVPGARWRRSGESFVKGTEGPLYLTVTIGEAGQHNVPTGESSTVRIHAAQA